MTKAKHPKNKFERLRLEEAKKPKAKGSSIRRAKEKEIIDDITEEAIADLQSYRDRTKQRYTGISD